jgi:hypothetical protein
MADQSSVFSRDALTITKTRIPEPGKDNHINIEGSIANWGGITGDGFLAGPEPGQDQLLVNGTQTAKTTGDRKVLINGHLTTNIISGEERTVQQGRTTTITPNETQTINGERTVTITGSNIRTILGPYLDTNVGPKTRNEVSSWFNYEGPIKLSIGGANLQVYGIVGELVGFKGEAMGIHLDASWMNNDNIGLKLSTGLLAACLTVVRPKIGVAKPDFGGVSTHAWYVGV